MTLQFQAAVSGTITEEMMVVAQDEGVSPEFVCERVKNGQIVILKGRFNQKKVVGIGKGLRTKINASIGTSSDRCDVNEEKAKAIVAEQTGADTLMELSAAGDLDEIRREVLSSVSLPVGNVPLYQAFCEAIQKYSDPTKLDPEALFDLIERQCADGMAFMAIHCGINLFTLERLQKQGYRYGGLCSKGGTLMIQWMLKNRRENPLYEQFDRVCDILARYDTILSLGNGIRAGAIHDSLDRAQMSELVLNCELAELARKRGCQAMVEGPGHVPLDEIEANIILQKKMSGDAPYYMLGPLPTDVGAGFDHITAAIGAAHSSMYGADLICYITPAEHLGLPDVEDVRVGVKTARLAAHIGDVVKLKGKADQRDKQVSKDRRDFKWTRQFGNLLFPEDARAILENRRSLSHKGCSMCGELCALKNAEVSLNEYLSDDKINSDSNSKALASKSLPDLLTTLNSKDVFVFLDTIRPSETERFSYLFTKPNAVLTVRTEDDLPGFFQGVQDALDAGCWVSGYFAYEFGYLLEPKLRPLLDRHRPDYPLAWLGVFSEPLTWGGSQGVSFDNVADFSLLDAQKVADFVFDVSLDEYLSAIDAIQRYIADGHTYQVNYTLRARFNLLSELTDFYLAMRQRQRVSYGAFMRTDFLDALSFSPELFFRLEDNKMTVKPMKGTAPRGKTLEDDKAIAEQLSADPKNRAENVMIVDLLRNDLGRIAKAGSVNVQRLFEVERYETLFQMTSTIEAELMPDIGISDVLKALFPCGSVTGAPKVRTMEIIAEQEKSPRGIYTGAIGFISPERKAVFNVPIRTVVVPRQPCAHCDAASTVQTVKTKRCEIGLGSGVTTCSDPESEYDECRLKAMFLLGSEEPQGDFKLIETMKFDPELVVTNPIEGFWLLSRHIKRLSDSARYFSFSFDDNCVLTQLNALANKLIVDKVSRRVRLLLDRDGSLELEVSPMPAAFSEPVKVAFYPEPVQSFDVFLYHKTTRRFLYEKAMSEAHKLGLFDCIFVNEKDEVTEGAITNVFWEDNGMLFTPPVTAGLLNGVLRQELIEQGRVCEQGINKEALFLSKAVFVGNSVRGLLRAVIVDV